MSAAIDGIAVARALAESGRFDASGDLGDVNVHG
jgi:hypothetical protein